jgi:integrase
VRLRDLAPEHVELLYRRILESGCGGGSVAHVKRTLRAALNTAVARGHLARNPVPLAHTPAHDVDEVEPYTVEEVRLILGAARRLRNGARWSVAFALGCRSGEALGLRWVDVDLDAREIKIRNALTWLEWQHGCVLNGEPTCGKRPSSCPRRRGGGAHLGPPKSKAGKRTIALPDALVAELREHRRSQATARLAAGSLWEDGDFVFTNTRGGPIDRTSDRDNWNALVDAAGVRRLRVHDARHTAATLLLVQGVDSRTLLGLFGWTSLALVQRYTHLVEDLRRDAANRMGSVLWGDHAEGTA